MTIRSLRHKKYVKRTTYKRKTYRRNFKKVKGGAAEYVKTINDLNEPYTKYQIVLKQSRTVFAYGNLTDLTDDDKMSLLKEFANRAEYDFLVL